MLPQQLDGRRSVRGCAVDELCGRASDVLREFQLEKVPEPGHDPWVSERAVTPSRLEVGAPRLVRKPSELRPDAPWLDQLELPDLPIKWSQRLVDYLVFYRDDPRGRAIMQGWLVAQGRYRDMILAHLHKAKLPEDLLYVAMIESSYDPNTLSRAGALGLWQWMPEGAKIYGLRRDRWVDERKDPYRSTIAQMDYFRDLYQRFADWHIALASFNVGYGAMLRSIARYNTNDYYQLCEYENAVPWETCWYTPKVLATAIVGRNRAAFRFDKLQVAAPERWEDVAVPASLPLGLIARAAGVPEADIKRLNPHLRQGRTPPGEAGYLVRVPVGTRVESQRRIAELASDWDGYDAYVVAHGERFEDVATTYGMSTSALKKLNNISHESEVEGGTVLVVPRISEAQRAKNRAK
ncbi:MAG: transglycosylase SLT domain-containing protein, partial [Deltaproteobacteria bacterium]|nr:transglycosylase SLT domain-containing protein [Deltaproteobacteria bacterium]